MKKKLFLIAMIITIIGIIIVAVKAFNVNLKYKAHKAISIPIGTEFNLQDIKLITDEVFGKEEVQLEKAGLYSDAVMVNVQNASQEQIENLRKKINEKYNVKQNITISIGKEYNVEDIKTIAKEVLSKEDVNVQKSSDDETYVVIESEIITEETLENLNNKINEKYELQNTTGSIGISQVITVNEIERVRLTDMAKQYILYIGIATVVILAYFVIRFRKLNASKVLVKSILLLVLSEVFYMAIIAITRYPIDKLIIMAAIAIYMIVATYLNKNFIEQASQK
ncbi:MAG: hypothetical protein J6A89_09135 [Clostridia bacterium]|nr:hypothetical protein [Clostridia bacterium]